MFAMCTMAYYMAAVKAVDTLSTLPMQLLLTCTGSTGRGYVFPDDLSGILLAATHTRSDSPVSCKFQILISQTWS